MRKHAVGAAVLAAAALLLVQLAPLRADAAPKPLKVFILAGQSNMDGQANVSSGSKVTMTSLMKRVARNTVRTWSA